jgi:hypothetical protein
MVGLRKHLGKICASFKKQDTPVTLILFHEMAVFEKERAGMGAAVAGAF